MNVIKFRGKTDDGDLVKGILIQYANGKVFRIWYEGKKYYYMPTVKPDTIAQFVGYDKNGEEIYSDDMVVEEIFPGAVPQKYIAGDRIPVNRIGEKFFNYELVKGGKK